MNVTTYDNALLITREDIDRECRPCSTQDALADRCIEEAQMLDIKPAVGDAVFLRLFDTADEAAQTLWNGGKYTDSCGNARIFAGLRKALLYYAYGRIVRASGGVATRFDYVVKADQYSDSADGKAKSQAYNEAFSIADGYKEQALLFMAEHPSDFGNERRKNINNRLQLKKIGY